MSVCCVCAFIIQWYLSVVLTCGVLVTFLWDVEGTGQRDRCNGMLIHQCWKTPYQWQNTHRGAQYLAFITLQLYLPLKLMCQIAKAPECSQTGTNCKHKKTYWLSSIEKQMLHQRYELYLYFYNSRLSVRSFYETAFWTIWHIQRSAGVHDGDIMEIGQYCCLNTLHALSKLIPPLQISQESANSFSH